MLHYTPQVIVEVQCVMIKETGELVQDCRKLECGSVGNLNVLKTELSSESIVSL